MTSHQIILEVVKLGGGGGGGIDPNDLLNLYGTVSLYIHARGSKLAEFNLAVERQTAKISGYTVLYTRKFWRGI